MWLKGFHGVSAVKHSPAMQETIYNAGDMSFISVLGRSLGEGNDNPLHIFTWEIPWTEEPGRL